MIIEKFILSDYIIETTTRSEIDPTKMLTLRTGLICPLCGKETKLIAHGETFKHGCGLQMEAEGNSLTCSVGERDLARIRGHIN